jgi:hypothetical protein
VLRPVAIAGERGGAVQLIHRSIKRPVCLPQLPRHGIGIVEVGERRGRKLRASVEDRLG